ncbi:SPW repeat domain-containing protein [Dyadobacter luticola]|uniref:SPW repeat-containing integral membrane domain-containing protein n=1 Tax=Dyadobacter luticola TaxID=1979387 RepID=A0A5R9L6E7_9BACT|nr:SPW repeat protein [Dyadobacter luticola]TLV03969.1 hypothetical protein FEN17_10420 [Dyadobacter luticola]
MNIISTRVHARIDYIAGIIFMASPWIFNFNESVPATWTPITIGFMALMMSLFTNYEGGMVRSIPMKAHLTVDIISGAFLAASPWLLGFSQEVFLPHLIMGLFEVTASLLTEKHASFEKVTETPVDPQAEGVNKTGPRV